MTDFLKEQMDFIYYFYGLAFLVLAFVFFSLWKREKERLTMPIQWLIGFALVHGLLELAEVPTVSLGDNPVYYALRVLLLGLSFFFLVEFGRRGINQLGKDLGLWIYFPLVALALLTGLYGGWSGLNAGFRYNFALPGSLLAGLVMFFHYRQCRDESRIWLGLGALLFLLYGISAGLIGPKADVFPAYWFNQDTVFAWMGIPIQLVRGVLAIGLAIVFWNYSFRIDQEHRDLLGLTTPWKSTAGPLSILLGLLLIGWGMTELASRMGQSEAIDDMVDRSLPLSISINGEAVTRLAANPSAVGEMVEDRQLLGGQLQAILSTTEGIRGISVVTLAGDQVVPLVDGLPLGSPQPMISPEELKGFLHMGGPLAVAPKTDSPEELPRYITPLKDPGTGQPVAVGVVEWDKGTWLATIANYRLIAIALLTLMNILTIGLFWIIYALRESTVRFAISESQFRAIFEGAPEAIMIFESNSLRILSANSFMVNAFGYSRDELLGMTVYDLLEPTVTGVRENVRKIVEEGLTSTLERIYIHKDGTPMHIDVTGAPVKYQGKDGVLVFLRDVTERKETDAELRQQDELLQGVAQASNHLLTETDINRAMAEALAVIGLRVKVSQICLFENHLDHEKGELVASQRMEWSLENGRITRDNPQLQKISYADYGIKGWYDQLSKGQAVCGLAEDFPQGEQKFLLAQHIESIMVVPILTGERFWGFIGFKERQRKREWTNHEKTILTAMAASIGGAIKRKEGEEQLAATRDRALEASRLKSEFVANMSHEIRTPMNAVMGMTELLSDTELSIEQREYTSIILKSAQSLLNIVNDILDFSKMEAGKYRLDKGDFNLLSVVEGTTELLASKANEKKLILASYVDPAIPLYLIGDAERLRQILLNLLGNAVKFTPSGEVVLGAVVVAETETHVTINFVVKDTGIGLSEVAKKRLFQPFTQADGSTTRKYGGTGLGLSIAGRLVELMGGQIGVDSEAGKGSSFWLTVTFERSSLEPKEQVEWESLRGKRALIVMESSTESEILERYLKTKGMDCEGLPEGKDILAKLQEAESEKPIEFVFVDLVVAEQGEFTLAKEIEEAKLSHPVKAFVLAGVDKGSKGERAVQAGFADCLFKPLKQSQLFELMRRSLEEESPKSTDGMDKFILPIETENLESQQKRILVVEDNPVNMRLAVSQLNKLGYQSHTAVNGREAVDALGQGDYDLILMDCMMPEMDGFEATRAIRKLEEGTGRHIPVVAITANAMEGYRELCLEAGMDDYISKPFSLADLARVMERWLQPPGEDGENEQAG